MPSGEQEPFVWIEAPDEVVRQLRDQGLEPLHDYTGIVEEVGALWPEGRARDVRELGHPDVDPDLAWYVRSPWDAIGLREVIRLLGYWADTTQDGWDERAREFLAWSPEQVMAFQREHPARPKTE